MEGSGQNSFMADLLSDTELYDNWGGLAFEALPEMTDFGETNHEEFQIGELLIQDERSTDQSAIADDQEVILENFAMDLERTILEEEPLSNTESDSNEEVGGAELDSKWDTSRFDDDSSSNINRGESNNMSADIRDLRKQMCIHEERSGDQSTGATIQDITLIEFIHDLERQLLLEHCAIGIQTVQMPETSPSDERTHENGATERVEETPRPVVLASESIGVTYHKKNKQWESHLWLKNQQLRNGRKKKGVQLFLGNFSTANEAKQAHDRAAIKLDLRETLRGKAYPLNFPESFQADYIAEHVCWSSRDFVWKLRRSSSKFNKGQSCMKGVSMRKGKQGSVVYEAKISQTKIEGKKVTFDLGRFASEDDAGRAYDRALLFFKGADEWNCVTNFRPSEYSVEEIQEAGSKLDSQKLAMLQ